MEQLKHEKGPKFAVIAYHISDVFELGNDVFDSRYEYYRPGASQGVPYAVIGGNNEFLGGIAGGNMYFYYLSAYNNAAALSPPVDIALSLQASNQVRVEVTNISGSTQTGNLHVAVVERFRYYVWKDLDVVDFVLRNMLTGGYGQSMTLSPSETESTVQNFSLSGGWNYVSIIAFFQTGDKQIQQGAFLELEDTIPFIQVSTPAAGVQLEPGSIQAIYWSIDRPIPYVSLQYSTDGGGNWTEIQSELTGTTYNWTVPQVNSTHCLISVRDQYGEAQGISGLFAIGLVQGDFNDDGVVNDTDRNILIDHLIENDARQLTGADLNEDGSVNLLDLIYFDTNLVE